MKKGPTTEELYEDMPDVFKDMLGGKKKEDKKEEGKTPFEILQETLRNIQAINKR